MPPKNKTLPWLLKTITLETDECVIWPFSVNQDGYGTTWYKGKPVHAHRLVLHLCTGFDLRSRLKVKHSCDNPPCVNKRHLSSGTQKENMQEASLRGRMVRTQKTRCSRGHLLDETNTYIAPCDGRRRCRKCRNMMTGLWELDEKTQKELGG